MINAKEISERTRSWLQFLSQIVASSSKFGSTTATVSITSIGNSNAWGFSGQPESLGAGVFTGTVQNAGSNSYQLTGLIMLVSGSTVPFTLSLGVNA